MSVIRLLAWVLLILAMVALVSDITRVAGGAPLVSTTIHSYWKNVSPQTLVASAAFVQRQLHPLVWDALVMRVLLLPLWFSIGAIGLVFAVIGRRKRHINIFAN